MADNPPSQPWLWGTEPGLGEPGRIAPNDAEILSGYRDGQAPAAGAFNWVIGELGDWVQWLRNSLVRTRVANWTVQNLEDESTLPTAGNAVRSVARGFRDEVDPPTPFYLAVGGAVDEGSTGHRLAFYSLDGVTWREAQGWLSVSGVSDQSGHNWHGVGYHASTGKWVMCGRGVWALVTCANPLLGNYALEAAPIAEIMEPFVGAPVNPWTYFIDKTLYALLTTELGFLAMGSPVDYGSPVGNAPLGFQSDDGGATWSAYPVPAFGNHTVRAIASSGAEIVIVGGSPLIPRVVRIVGSSPGVLATLPEGITGMCRAVVWNGRVYMAACDGNQIMVSLDGVSWEQRTDMAPNGSDRGVYLSADPNTGAVIGGFGPALDKANSGMFLTLDDGETWEEVGSPDGIQSVPNPMGGDANVPAPRRLYSVTHVQGRFFAGFDGALASSLRML